MSAKLEICLYVGFFKTRFDTWDDVKITLKDGRIVEGTILPMECTRYFEVNTEKGVVLVYPGDIKDCVEVKNEIN